MKIKKRYFYVCVVLLIVLITAASYYFYKPKKTEKKEEIWKVDENGYLSYPLNREPVKFNRQDYGISGNLTIHKIIYQSRNDNIYGLLVLPSTAADLLPGIVLLPGAGVSKESELEFAKKIAILDAAVLVIDQRGVGETNGQFPTLDEDYASFLGGKEPVQHLMVYDALRAYDLLKNAPFVDSDRIAIAGESLGGRIAIIAAAIDRNVNGALAISSSGLDFEETNDTRVNAFLKSINSDHYIGLIAPRKVVIVHNKYDNIITFDSALNSYKKAQEPKGFILVNDTSCNHGYCDSMYNGLVDALDYLVGIRSRTLVSISEQK
ncbi:acetylxylan esterase [Candidatus Woesearchaeota archaeon]|nr:acetylxylan esterase [Candidatus Woesearchaeota archaeon]